MRKLSYKPNIILMAIFAIFAIAMQAAFSRAFVYGLFAETTIHGSIFLVFFLVYAVFTHNALKSRFPRKTMKIITALYISVFIIMMILLTGFQKFIPAIIVSIVYISVPFAFVFDNSIKKSIVSGLLAMIILFNVTIPGYFYKKFEILIRENTEELYISEENGYFTHGVMPEKLYIYSDEPTTTADVLLHNSIQAYTSQRYTDQIIYEQDKNTSAEYTKIHLDTIAKYYPDVEQQYVTNQDALLDIYADRIQNYILYDDTDLDSIFTAANLCNQMEAIMIAKSIQPIADMYGWKQVFDTTGWTEEMFVNSKYFKNIDNHLLVMVGPFSDDFTHSSELFMSQFWDLGILNNAWMVHNKFTINQLEGRLKHLQRNSICIGSISGNAENAVVQACARYATTFIYTVYTANMSVLSSFDLQQSKVNTDVLTDGNIHKLTPTQYSDDSTPKHTVCVMLSDADNVRFCTESLMNPHYYQSPLRDEDLQYNIGLAGSMVEIAPIFLLEFYDDMNHSTDFCYQLSSVGYTYPSKWTDTKAWEQVTKTITGVMADSQTHVLEIMDDSAFMGVLDVPHNFDSLQKYFDTYTCYDDVDGCLFIDYTALYSGYRGAICWSNDKPVVSAKYSVWYDEGTPYNTERNTIDTIAKEINEMSTDKTSEDAYTFIIIHGWSGLDTNGNLVYLNLATKDVDNTAIFTALRDSFDEDVEMVSTTEFINRMRRNVKR